MNPVLIWFFMALLLVAGLWSANYLLPMIRLIRTYWHNPIGLPHTPRALIFALAFSILGTVFIPTDSVPQGSVPTEFSEPTYSVIAKQGHFYFQEMVQAQFLRLDPNVHYQHIRPEITYALATVLQTVQQVSGKKHLIVSSVNDRRHTRNSFHYRNLAIDLPMARLGVTPRQGVRIRKKLAQRLGPGYRIIYGTEGHTRHMHIQYEGPAWNAEKIMALPILQAATQEHVHPALLLAWAKVSTGFDPHFNDQRGHRGVLGLPNHLSPLLSHPDTLDLNAYLRTGAQLLRSRLQQTRGDTALALAALHSNHNYHIPPASTWWKDPIVAAWVDQILFESKNYQHKFSGSSWTETLAKTSQLAEES